MSDQETFIQLLRGWGISTITMEPRGDGQLITLEAKTDPLIKGYYGFVGCFNFDAEGRFVDMGFYE